MKVFLIIFDTLRKDHTGETYGNNWIKTPNFDRFVQDSIVFDKAYPESLPTIPVRRAIHTGLRTFPFNHKRPQLRTDDVVEIPGWYPIPPNQKHLAEYLNKHGYVTGFITSTYHQFKPNMNFHLGFDQWNWIRGHEDDKLRARYRGRRSSFNKKVKKHIIGNDPTSRFMQRHVLEQYFRNVQDRKSEVEYFPARTFQKAIDFVKDTRSFNSIFCLIDEFDPHEPWDPPKDYLELYVDKDYTGRKAITPNYNESLDYIKKEELEYLRACYAGEVSLCDNWFGYFINELKQMELSEDSLLILISDHGHSIGEHNATGKLPTCLYPELIDIPLIIKPPGNLKTSKRINKSFVYNHDLLPTILGFLNKNKPECDGYDLSMFFDEPDQLIKDRDYITCGMGLFTAYVDDRYAMISSNDQKHQKLFDLDKDPDWNTDISDNNADICAELFQKIKNDANGDLLLHFTSKLDDLKDWYLQKTNIAD